MTINRWVASGVLPKPIKMKTNGRRLWDEAEIEQIERQRMNARQPDEAA
jgi:predicted DNA-binding transcriptional regulator AlpA